MIKVGDIVKGFRFRGHSVLSYDPEMENYYGVEGSVRFVEQEYDRFMIEFEDHNGSKWWYPLSEYLEAQRDERLKELGILDEVEITRK